MKGPSADRYEDPSKPLQRPLQRTPLKPFRSPSGVRGFCSRKIKVLKLQNGRCCRDCFVMTPFVRSRSYGGTWHLCRTKLTRYKLVNFGQEKRAQRLTCWVWRPPVGWGSSTRRGGGRKVRARPRKFVFLGFQREVSGMSRKILPGCPGPLGVFTLFKKFVHKKFVRIFRSLTKLSFACPIYASSLLLSKARTLGDGVCACFPLSRCSLY